VEEKIGGKIKNRNLRAKSAPRGQRVRKNGRITVSSAYQGETLARGGNVASCRWKGTQTVSLGPKKKKKKKKKKES